MKMYDFVEKANKNQHKHMRMVVFSSYRHVIVYWRVSETQPFHLPKIQCRIARSARAIELVDGGRAWKPVTRWGWGGISSLAISRKKEVK